MFVKYPQNTIKKPLENSSGFTLIEILVVVSILVVLGAISIPAFDAFLKSSDVDNGMQEFQAVLRLAQSKTVSSENESQYGVFIDTSVSPHKYVIFKGVSYVTRDTAFDQLFWLSKTTEFSGISLGGGNEVVFNRLTGYATQSGSVSIRLKADVSKIKTIYIAGSGVLSFTAPAIVDDTRLKDSRHIHFDYSRAITTGTETITLLFDNTVSQVIPISTNMSGGQIEWTGTVSVGGALQTVSVKTHRLNNPDTQFSIHRDRRLNNKSLKITISGDNSGNLVLYSADGVTTSFSSIYVSNFNWQ